MNNSSAGKIKLYLIEILSVLLHIGIPAKGIDFSECWGDWAYAG